MFLNLSSSVAFVMSFLFMCLYSGVLFPSTCTFTICQIWSEGMTVNILRRKKDTSVSSRLSCQSGHALKCSNG